MRCLQDAYEAKTHASVEYPACPTCKHHYHGSLALMLLDLKRERLEAMLKPGMRVLVVGLAASQYNGLAANLLEYDSGTLRWKVRLGNDDIKAIRTENLVQEDSELQHTKVNTLRSLGIAYSSANEPQNAATLLERAVRIEEQLFGENEEDLSVTLTNLGIIYSQLKEGSKAVEVLQRALALKEPGVGPNAVELVPTLSSLGMARLEIGEAEAALKTLERALDIGETKLGKEHADLVPTLLHAASACRKLDRHARAVELTERALRAQERQLGEGHAALASTLADLGAACGALGDRDRQIQVLERAYACALAGVGVAGQHDLAMLLPILTSLREAYQDIGDQSKAQVCEERSRALLEQSLAPSVK